MPDLLINSCGPLYGSPLKRNALCPPLPCLMDLNDFLKTLFLLPMWPLILALVWRKRHSRAWLMATVVDASYLIEQDATLAIVTDRSDEALDIIRHSSAHLLAMAVKQLFPSAQVTIGPVIEDGFYYDFAFERAFTPEDLELIETRMTELSSEDLAITREEWDRDEAVEFFKGIGEAYKAEIIASIPADQAIGLYRQGDFIDLCRGPHVPSTGKLSAFKLTKVAGAYWRGDSNNEMLQRIYGTAWSNKKELKAYINRLAEAEKRDHRKINKKLDLYHMQEEAPGSIFWHPKGWSVYSAIEEYMRGKQRAQGYQEIKTPQIVDMSLWEKSGHADKFGDDMFSLQTEDRTYAVKPMNCPCHVQVFNQGLKSYRDLPLRLAEFGSCHRNEPSGSLHGIMRVRSFTQDDAHIFCTEEQIQPEVSQFIDFLHEVYADFGFRLKLSIASLLALQSEWVLMKTGIVLKRLLVKRWMPKNYLGRNCQERAPFMAPRLSSH